MAQRKCVYVSRREPVDGGESPNRYVPEITVEIRVFAPPHTKADDIYDVAYEASSEVYDKIYEGNWK